MRSTEAGFTMIEMVIAVAIGLIVLAAGGMWLLSMQPGALRAAVNDVDADFAAAQAIAESSGNGATLVFAPRAGGVPGFTLRVYSGRPNASGAVTPTTVMAVTSETAIGEKTFGSPPFAIFLNSAGYATGSAGYPALDAQENPTFTVIAAQPPCPPGGIVLTFTSPQGATATRTYACNTMVAGTSASDPTPTPNPPHISPTYLLAHDTSDAGPLRFKAAEYGYYHWYASTKNGAACQTLASQTGAAPASFASPWPYAQPSPAAQSSASPAPPNLAPYTWPSGDPNDPPAWFQLTPTLHDGGLCTVTVADDYNQSGAVTVQVMGDLTASTASLSLQVGKGSQTVGFSKVFDSEKLLLSAGGRCLGVISVATASGSYPSSPSSTPATASVTVTPVSAGSCVMQVEDQYGEIVSIAIDVKAAQQDFLTWPAQLVVGSGGAAVGTTAGVIAASDVPLVARVAPLLNALLGGGVARAASSGPCYAWALQSGVTAPAGGATPAPSQVDASIPSSIAGDLGLGVTTDGCIVKSDGSASTTGEMVVYEPVGSGQTGNYSYVPPACAFALGSWNPGDSGAYASLPAAAATPGACTVDFSDGASTQTPAADSGAVAVTAIDAIPCTPDSYGYCAVQTAHVDSTLEPVDCDEAGGIVIKAENVASPAWTSYAVYSASGLLGAFTETVELKLVSCTNVTYNTPDGSYDWKPSDPASTYGDPNLP